MIFSKANFGTFSTSVTIQVCGAVTGVLTARLLGPVARGELATVILWPTVLSNLGLMGCNWALAREVAKNPEREREWVGGGLAAGLATALVYFLGGYFLIPILLPSARAHLIPVARLCLWLIPLDICNQILLAVDHGCMRWRRFNVLRLSFFLFYLVLICFAGITRRAQVRWFVSAFLASHFLAVLLRLWIHRKSLASRGLRLLECCQLLRSGMPYFGATLSNLLSLQLDTILVVSLFSSEAAGIYAVAGAFANGQSSLGEALGITSFGVLSNENDSNCQARMIGDIFRQAALASCGVGLALACVLPIVVVPLFGSPYSRAVRPAVILALAACLASTANVLNQALRGAGRPHAGLISQLFGSAVMASVALVLLRHFGLVGISIAVGLSICAQLLVLIYVAASWLKISPLEFWPFRAGNLRQFFRQIAGFRPRYSRSAA